MIVKTCMLLRQDDRIGVRLALSRDFFPVLLQHTVKVCLAKRIHTTPLVTQRHMGCGKEKLLRCGKEKLPCASPVALSLFEFEFSAGCSPVR